MSGINCIGFVMDGNRRWAKEQNLKTIEGHKQGFEKYKEVVEWLKDTEITNAIFYAFSTENWKRTKEEIDYLMELFENAFSSVEVAHKNKVRIRFLGQIDRLPQKLQTLVKKIE